MRSPRPRRCWRAAEVTAGASRAGAASGPERVSRHVWRLPLPSRTLPPFDHVNVHLVVSNGVGVVVDPGSAGGEAARATADALAHAGVRLLKAVLLTHTHPDHVAGLPALLETHPGCAVYVHPLEAARLSLASTVALEDDRRVVVGDATLRSVHTPGHSPGHLAYLVEEDGVALVGDLVAGRGSTWVGVPEGDVEAYLASLERLRRLSPTRLAPGHGPLVEDADATLAAAAEHRRERERQILRALAPGASDLATLRQRVYPALPPEAHDLAERSLLAHLRKLMHEMRVLHLGENASGPYALRR